jgi:hypothetical protein
MYRNTIATVPATDMRRTIGPGATELYPPDGIFRPDGRGHYDPQRPSAGYDYQDAHGQWWHVEKDAGPDNLMRAAFMMANVAEQAADLRVYGDEAGKHTVIVTMIACRVIIERDGKRITSSKVASVPLGGIDPEIILASGRVISAREARREPHRADRGVAYLRQRRLHDRTWWAVVGMYGTPTTEHATREEAIAAATS